MAKRKSAQRSWRRLLRRCLIVLAALLLSVSLLITASDVWHWGILPTWHELYVAVGLEKPAVSANELRVTFLNVGNADCILIQSGTQAALVDAGTYEDSDATVSALRRAGVERLDHVIATHTDSDHIGGMAKVIRELEIGTVLIPYMPEDTVVSTRVYAAMMSAMEDKGIQPTQARYGLTYAIGGAELKVISGRRLYGESNDQSIVCRVTFGDNAFLLMGDASAEVERYLMLDGAELSADVIKIGHHGSGTSSDPGFISEVDPDYAVITCGVDNYAGHPHEDTLQTLQKNDVAVYRTDHHGDIVFTGNGSTLSVTTEW